jgi:nitrite reductase (cytochrome c-552)
MRVGAMKLSDHWVRSPLLNVNDACQTCHTQAEDELLNGAHRIQDATYELRNVAIDAVLDLARAIAAADASAPEADLARARDYQRQAQFLADFIEAENSMGFHAPQEAMRVLGHSLNYARLGMTAVLAGATAPN